MNWSRDVITTPSTLWCAAALEANNSNIYNKFGNSNSNSCNAVVTLNIPVISLASAPLAGAVVVILAENCLLKYLTNERNN